MGVGHWTTLHNVYFLILFPSVYTRSPRSEPSSVLAILAPSSGPMERKAPLCERVCLVRRKTFNVLSIWGDVIGKRRNNGLLYCLVVGKWFILLLTFFERDIFLRIHKKKKKSCFTVINIKVDKRSGRHFLEFFNANLLIKFEFFKS